MNGRAITFDFHNTLAACPEWFELELRTLPSAFLEWRSSSHKPPVTAESAAEAESLYRNLRRDIMEHGNELTAEACLAHVFAQMGVDVPQSDIETGVALLMRRALAGASPIPGAIETVRDLHRIGVPIGVVSSAVYHPFLEWALTDFGLLERLAFVATSASIGYYKSDIRIYHHAYGLAGGTVELGVHVGDSPRWDVAMAREAGLGTVLYTAPGTNRPEVAHDIVPDLTLTSLVGADQPILALLREREAGVAPS